MNHHRMFTHIRRSNDTLLLLNLLLLLGVTAVPFPTAVLASSLGTTEQRTAAIFYNSVFVVIAVFFNVLWRYAVSHQLLDKEAISSAAMISRQYSVGPLIYLLCLALASSAGLATPSLAQGLAAQSAKINALGDAGKYPEAIPLAEAMLASLEKGPPSKDLAGAMNNLAQLHGDVGRDTEAEPLYMRALAIMEKTVGVDSVAIAPELNNLAALYQRQLRYAEAEPLFTRAPVVALWK